MEYNERMELVLGELIELLSVYDLPRNLKSEKQTKDHLELLARSVNKRFPNDTTEDHIRGTFERAAIELSSKRKSNTWPVNHLIIKAIDAAKGIEAKSEKSFDKTKALETAIKIFTGETGSDMFAHFKGRAHGQFNKGWIAKELMKAGLLRDERDAHWRGFDMSDYMSKVHSQRMTMDEWRNHIRIMARLRGVTEKEAAKIEVYGSELIQAHSDETLPIEVYEYKNKNI